MRGENDNVRKRILLVEDDSAVRRALQLLLTAEGYEVRSYASGIGLELDHQALDSACMVADLVMPEVNGFELLRNLRGAGWPGVAILFSGYLADHHMEAALKAGFSRIIEKAVGEAALVREIASVFREQSSEPTSASGGVKHGNSPTPEAG